MTSPLSLLAALAAPDVATASDPVADPAMFSAALLAALQPVALATGEPEVTPVVLLDPPSTGETRDESATPDANPAATAGHDESAASVAPNPARTAAHVTLGALLVPKVREANEAAVMHRSSQRTEAPRVPNAAAPAPAPSLPTSGAPGQLRRPVATERATVREATAIVKLTPPVVEIGVAASVTAAAPASTRGVDRAISTAEAPQGNIGGATTVIAGTETVVEMVSANGTMPVASSSIAVSDKVEVSAQTGSPAPHEPIPAALDTEPRNAANVAPPAASPATSRRAAPPQTASMPVHASLHGEPVAPTKETAEGEVHPRPIARPRRERSDPVAYPIREQAGTGLVPATPQIPEAPGRRAEQHSTPGHDQTLDTQPQVPSASITDQAAVLGAAIATGRTVISPAAANDTSGSQDAHGRGVYPEPAGQEQSDAAAGGEPTTTSRMDLAARRDDTRDTTPRTSLASAFAHALAELLGDGEIAAVKLTRGRPESAGDEREPSAAPSGRTAPLPAMAGASAASERSGSTVGNDQVATMGSERPQGRSTRGTHQPVADAKGDTAVLMSGAARLPRAPLATVTPSRVAAMPRSMPEAAWEMVERRGVPTERMERKLPSDRQELPPDPKTRAHDADTGRREPVARGDTPSDTHTNSSSSLGGQLQRGGEPAPRPHEVGSGEARNLPGRDQHRESPAGLADRVTLQFTDADGRPTRIRVAVLGEQIRAVILPPDRETGRQLERRMDDLHAALVRQGFVDPRVSVQQSVTSEAAAGWVPPSRTDVPVPRGAEQPADDQRQGSGRREQHQHGEQQRHPQGRSRDRDPEPRQKESDS